jgi:hypothetical protein
MREEHSTQTQPPSNAPQAKEELRERQSATLAKYRHLGPEANRGKSWSEDRKAKQRGHSLPGRIKVPRWALAEDALQGLTTYESASKHKISQLAVFQARKRMGFPAGESGLFYHGEVLTRRRLKQFCEDVHLSEREIAHRFQIARFSRRLDRLDRPLTRQIGQVLARAYDNVIECLCEPGDLRHKFLRSEIRDIPQKHSLLVQAFGTLRDALMQNQVPKAEPLSILEWLCQRAQKEAFRQPSQRVMRTMLFFGLPLLKTLVRRSWVLSDTKKFDNRQVFGFWPTAAASNFSRKTIRRAETESVMLSLVKSRRRRSLAA